MTDCRRTAFVGRGLPPGGVSAAVLDASSGQMTTVSTMLTDHIMTVRRTRAIVNLFCVALLSACTVAPPPAEPPALPPGVFGMYQDNDVGALNQSSVALAMPSQTRNNPIDAARAIIAVEYLADELRVNPRWIGMSGTSKLGMVQARTDTRRVLGIAPDAPPRLVVDALLRLTVALREGDQASALRTLTAPVFSLPPSQTLQILTNLPYIQSANQATLQAANEEFPR